MCSPSNQPRLYQLVATPSAGDGHVVTLGELGLEKVDGEGLTWTFGWATIHRMRGGAAGKHSHPLAPGTKHPARKGLALLSGGSLVASLLSLVLVVPAHASTSVPSPTAGGWTLLGNAAVVSSASPAYLQLTNASSAGYEAGLAYYPTAVHGVGVTATFDALWENGTGADGLTFALLNAASGPPVLGVEGGGLGLGGNNGIAVALDTYQNGHNPSANFVGLTNDAISGGDVGTPVMDALQWVATSTNVPTLHDSSSPIHVVVTTATTGVTVSVNGTQVLSWTGTVPTSAYLAFTGGDGGLTDLHAVENVTITTGGTSSGPGVLSLSSTSVPKATT